MTQKLVNGEMVDLTPDEQADYDARQSVVIMPIEAEYTVAIQAMLDKKAQERHYDGILSACTYATSTVAKFQAEGQACVEFRDAVWDRSYALMAQVQGGEIPQPTIPELLGMLPTMAWPA
jgi:hypothetical protein